MDLFTQLALLCLCLQIVLFRPAARSNDETTTTTTLYTNKIVFGAQKQFIMQIEDDHQLVVRALNSQSALYDTKLIIRTD